ncbi:branched-chain amino acid ABC transporter permease [Nonomuraea sp. NPDC050556]|uniref:branched-chain amino acid ABC transporter permease n=1 Tax=Nonomuraea sp. NPDC050556 TaxID=3364369 RepID=UPI00379D43B6
MPETLANIVVTAAAYSLVAVGLTTIYGVLRVLHIAHAGVYAFGAYCGYTAYTFTGSFWVAFAGAAAGAALLGVAIFWLVYRPLLAQPRAIPLLASIGLFIMITALLARPFLLGPDIHALPASSGLPALAGLSSIQVTIVVVAVLAVVGVYLLVRRTRLGLSWRAITADAQMAAGNGVNLDAGITANFAIGSALAGVAALLTAVYTNSVTASMGDVISYKAFVIVVLGGLGSVPGAVAASFLLAAAEIVSTRYAGSFLPRDAIAFLVLILVLLARPQGMVSRA